MKERYGEEYTDSELLRICHRSRSGYYAYIKAKAEENSAEQKRKTFDENIKAMMRSIIKKLAYIPGNRTFKTFLWRLYHVNLGRKRISRLMREMNLIANTPRKDAYKGQAKHDHPCVAPQNLVSQNFRVRPRMILCTDITYLYYGENRSLLYLCVFKDAYTKEILGWALSSTMSTDLIREAYERMMNAHGNELKASPKVLVQSDQGSQFLSTTFKKLLSDDDLLQSVSARANSQDNAPVESFFGRLKTVLLDMMKMCPNALTAEKLVEKYLDNYNNTIYQYNLCGLTPHEFYEYSMTGIYPCDDYYGISASEFLSLEEVIHRDQERTEKRLAKLRDTYAERSRVSRILNKDPIEVTVSDQNLLRKWIERYGEKIDCLNSERERLTDVLVKAIDAQKYLEEMSSEKRVEYCNPEAWQADPKLSYIFEMGGLF